MIDIKAKIAAGIASALLLTVAMAPSAFAETFVSIHGNGSFSDNEVEISGSNSTSIVQNNESTIVNDVDVSNNTGGNRASGNTGGDVSIETGDATSNVEIINHGNTNVASLNDCGCDEDLSVVISGNGFRSDNEVSIDQDNSKEVIQNNDTFISNDVDVDNNTGDNRANNNTSGFVHHPFVLFHHDFDKHHGDHDWDKKFHEWENDDWKFWLHNHFGDHNWHEFFSDLSDGEVSITTGDAESDVEIHNFGGTNVLE